MKFTEVVIVYLFLFSLLIGATCSFKSIMQLEEQAYLYRRKTSASYFISESFKKTCKGQGFENLNEWQVVCRAMWKLDYIGWSDAEEFMEVDYTLCEKKLMYGKWVREDGFLLEGEVYCRSL